MIRARFPKANGRCNTEITVLSNQYLVDRSAKETETDSCNSSLSTGELEIGYWQGGYIISMVLALDTISQGCMLTSTRNYTLPEVSAYRIMIL